MYIEAELHHDVTTKVILCSDDREKYLAKKYCDIEMEAETRMLGYRICKHVHIVKYTCTDYVVFKETLWRWMFGYESECPVKRIPDAGRAM